MAKRKFVTLDGMSGYSEALASKVKSAVDAKQDALTEAQLAAAGSGITSGKVSSYDAHVADTSNPHGVTAAQVGLGNVDNTSDADKPVSDAVQAALDLKVPSSEKGSAGGVAQLDDSGKVPSSQLPSYVDDVLEYAGKADFPAAGETGKIYVDTSTNLTYRWGGSAYVEISQSLALGETSSTAYAGDKGKANADAIAVLQTEVANLEAGTITVDGELSDTSDNPVQNRAVKAAIDAKQDALSSDDAEFSSGVMTLNAATDAELVAIVDALVI